MRESMMRKVWPYPPPTSCQPPPPVDVRQDNGIGWAIEQLQNGLRVCRSGWNGKGLFLVYVPGSSVTVTEGKPLATAFPIGTKFDYQPHVDMWTAQGTLVPWLCSQTDLLATDWELAGFATPPV